LQPLLPFLEALGGLGEGGETLAAAPHRLAAVRQLTGAAASLGPQLDWLLGMDDPRTYLLLVQNNHELRATGGFLSAFGTAVVEKGALAELSFVDSYQLFSVQHEYGPAPEPMQRYMGIQLLVARDANWSPDLPSAAKTIRDLYEQETGRAVDGIITLDLHAVRHLVAALGEVRVEGVDVPITAANVENELVRLWEQPPDAENAAAGGSDPEGAGEDWWVRRKDFVPLVAEAALARVQAGEYGAASLATELVAALDDRSIQVWVDQPHAQGVLAERLWDGGMHPLAGSDYLAVVDSNVGYNKVDAAMHREAAYAVEWPDGEDGGALATLTLTYTHPVAASDGLCDAAPRYGEGYADLIARCYFDYVRVYAPGGSRLLDVDGVDPETISAAPGEQGTQQFGGYLVVGPNSSKTITFTYRLPPGITQNNYHLRVQRQAGTNPLPLHVSAAGHQETASVEKGVWDWNPIP
jgi:hypothetical protein